jgi:hypothetical protein
MTKQKVEEAYDIIGRWWHVKGDRKAGLTLLIMKDAVKTAR